MERKSRLNYIVKIGVLSGLAGALMLIKIPLAIFPDWLTIDISDVPAVIGALVLGPLAGIGIEVVKVLVNLMLNGTQTGGIGEIANIIIGVSLVTPIGLMYKKDKSLKSALIGCFLGVAAMTVVGLAMNYFVMIPLYAKLFNMEPFGFVEMYQHLPVTGKLINTYFEFIVIIFAPFNIIKGLMITVITALIYKFVIPPLTRM